MPTIREATFLKTGANIRRNNRKGQDTENVRLISLPPKNPRCAITCNRWVILAGHSRRACTFTKSSMLQPPLRNFSAKKLAVATASCTAKLMPTPPMGDMAWAASPIHNKPSLYQRSKRLTCTLSNFTLSQESIACTAS